jgi:hypothetical protein
MRSKDLDSPTLNLTFLGAGGGWDAAPCFDFAGAAAAAGACWLISGMLVGGWRTQESYKQGTKYYSE